MALTRFAIDFKANLQIELLAPLPGCCPSCNHAPGVFASLDPRLIAATPAGVTRTDADNPTTHARQRAREAFIPSRMTSGLGVHTIAALDLSSVGCCNPSCLQRARELAILLSNCQRAKLVELFEEHSLSATKSKYDQNWDLDSLL